MTGLPLGLGVGEPIFSSGAMLGSLQRCRVPVTHWWIFAPGLVLIPVFLSYHALPMRSWDASTSFRSEHGEISRPLESVCAHCWLAILHPVAQVGPVAPARAQGKQSGRKRVEDRAQRLVAKNLPLICLASPNVLAGARSNIGNVQPAALEPYALWNADQRFVIALRPGASR